MNPLAIRIAADLKAFKANMQEMRVQLETNQAAMKRMASAFDGNKVIGDANAMVKAIHEIGGASKLTDTEMKRVNSTVTEAIAKYKALGREAPPELLALRDATIKADKPMKDLGDSSTSLMGKLKGMAGMLGIAFGGAAVISGIKSLISNTFEYAETIKDTSAKLAISMEATQRWKFAAEQTGASLENVSKSVLKLSQGVAGGDKGLKEALESAGIQFASIKGMNPEEAFNLVADAIAKIEDPMVQADVALAAFGKSGAELLPALREGFVELSRGVKVMSDKTIEDLDRAKDAWSKLQTQVTIATGGMLGKFSLFIEKLAPKMTALLLVMGQFDQAEMWSAFAKGADKAKDSLDAMSASEKLAAAALFKRGETVQQVAQFLGKSVTVVQAYADSLKKVPPELDRNTGSQKRYNTELKTAIKELPFVISAYGGLSSMLRNLSDTYTKLAAAPQIKALPFSDYMTKAQWSDILNIGAIGSLAKVPAAEFGFNFTDSLTKALSGLGSVIVGAIQGGGSVGKAMFASIGSTLGNDLGVEITKGLTKSLGKSMAGLIGGLAGPLGGLLGSAVGGLIDKIFGKNQGREDAKAFAAMFGGFDALREKMLVLGDEGDKLWIALTQNTKGPAQVAQAIKAIEDALAKAEAAAVKTGDALEDTFKGPEGARGFPTRAQLQKAAAEAEAAYRYMAASGEYTADVLEQAWNQWQDAMIASGDETAKRMKELTQEIASLQKAVEAETPEYDVNGVRMYGVEELRNIERLAALEAEKAALNIIQIENEAHATEEAAKQADLQAKKEFEAAKIRALDLDGYLRKLFTGGYEIPITFKLPNGVPSGPAGSSPSWFGGGSSIPASSGGGMATSHITVVIPMDGEVVAQKTITHTAKLLPRQLQFVGATQG